MPISVSYSVPPYPPVHGADGGRVDMEGEGGRGVQNPHPFRDLALYPPTPPDHQRISLLSAYPPDRGGPGHIFCTPLPPQNLPTQWGGYVQCSYVRGAVLIY